MAVTDPRLHAALNSAARQAERHCRRHDTPWSRSVHERLRDAAATGSAPDRQWLSAAIREAAADPDDDTLALIAALGAVVRAAGPPAG